MSAARTRRSYTRKVDLAGRRRVDAAIAVAAATLGMSVEALTGDVSTPQARAALCAVRRVTACGWMTLGDAFGAVEAIVVRRRVEMAECGIQRGGAFAATLKRQVADIEAAISKAEGRPRVGSQMRDRKCLCCGKDFLSEHFGVRLCTTCRAEKTVDAIDEPFRVLS